HILQALGEALRLDLCVGWTVDPAAGVLRHAHGWRSAALPLTDWQETDRTVTHPNGVGLLGRAWAGSLPVWGGEGEALPRKSGGGSRLLGETFAFPILFGVEVLGVIECGRLDPQGPSEALTETLLSIGAQIGRFIKHRQAEEAVHQSEARKAAILESALDA